jgi:general nucleoside transport system permease protein
MSAFRTHWAIVALVLGAFGALILIILASGASPMETAQALLRGSLGSPAAISGTLRETTPLLIAGLAVFIALRAGLFNIGVDGQLVVGAMACAVVALRVPGVPGILLGALAGVVAGALWALPAGLIKAYRNGHEVITTIMLNNIAGFLTGWLAAGAIRDPTQGNPTTAVLTDPTRLPPIYNQPPVHINSGLVVGLVVAALLFYWLRRTVAGYELQAVGANPTAAKFAGVSTRRATITAMAVSGAIAGMAGAVQVLAYEHRFYAGFSPGYGFDALGVALLAGASAFGVIPAAFLFGVLAQGGTAIQIFGIPKGITTIVLGLLILVAGAVRYRTARVHHD